jgi:hypothetical protein
VIQAHPAHQIPPHGHIFSITTDDNHIIFLNKAIHAPSCLELVCIVVYLIEEITMKLNRQALMVLVLIIAITIWAVNLIRPRSYSDNQLNFAVGSGTVTINNPSDEPVPVLLSGISSRTFSLTSNIEGVSGRSTREGGGRTATQLFAFELPAGSSEFTVENGTEVTFIADTATQLTATVQPVSVGTTRNTIIALIIAIAGSLYYISSTMNHGWIAQLRGITPVEAAPLPVLSNAADAHGRPMKSFGDNISRKSE